MRLNTFFNILFIIGGLIALTTSCDISDNGTTDRGQLAFSTDTLSFDTILTTIGSTTKQLKVYNNGKKNLIVSNIRLGKKDSPYRLNIDGVAANQLAMVEIPAKDSLYIFVEITPDESKQNLPLEIKDSIIFETNQNEQNVKLLSWGQDFNAVNSGNISETHWDSKKPYLIKKPVTVPANQTLTIDAGAKIYFHKDAAFLVRGNVIANGTLDEPIIFRSDRLESTYKNLPDQWTGIIFISGSQNNKMNHVRVTNANIGVQVGTIEHDGYSTLDIRNSIIAHHGYIGLISIKSNITSYNNLIADCGYYAASLLAGGSHDFKHTTIANYWSWSGHVRTSSSPALQLSNVLVYKKDGKDVALINALNNAQFGNCIISGNLLNEVELGNNNAAAFNYEFKNCFLQVNNEFDTSDNNHYKNIIREGRPKYKNISKFNFQLDTLSTMKDAGDIEIGKMLPIDILGNSRTSDKGPDLGAYERIEPKE
ncbi:hypothetical protein EMN47_14605 [Prolixibacteraceae bacterium JC049]|nr:hypothetical protein [Prolixibacteraceae bacterium JC049]